MRVQKTTSRDFAIFTVIKENGKGYFTFEEVRAQLQLEEYLKFTEEDKRIKKGEPGWYNNILWRLKSYQDKKVFLSRFNNTWEVNRLLFDETYLKIAKKIAREYSIGKSSYNYMDIALIELAQKIVDDYMIDIMYE